MTAITDEKSESDSEMPNIYEGGIFQKKKKIGLSNSLLLPPGTVIAAVATRAATKDKELPYLFIHFLPL